MAVSCARTDCENNGGVYCQQAAWGLEIDAQGCCASYKQESHKDEPGASCKLKPPPEFYPERSTASKR